jgi:hypothetical protein
MDFNPVSLLLFILVLVPGYIFIHILDYYLVKGEKSQFEKTVQGIIASTIIWILFLFLPFMNEQKSVIIDYLRKIVIGNNLVNEDTMSEVINAVLITYSIVFLVSLIIGNIWGLVRRHQKIDDIFRFFTGRDRYRTVSLRFFTEYYGATVVVTCSDSKKYTGVLCGAPDDSEDAIIINKPFVIENNKFVRISATAMLLFLDKITRIEVIKPLVRRK